MTKMSVRKGSRGSSVACSDRLRRHKENLRCVFRSSYFASPLPAPRNNLQQDACSPFLSCKLEATLRPNFTVHTVDGECLKWAVLNADGPSGSDAESDYPMYNGTMKLCQVRNVEQQ